MRCARYCSGIPVRLIYTSFKTGQILDTKTLKIAFRRARVVQDKLIDQEGLTFLFEINNVRIFCGGLCSGL